jgi:hypothetical protein
MSVLISHVTSWPTLGCALLVYGFAPGALLRLIVLLYPRDHPSRRELIGELYAYPRIKRPFWVAEQLETALLEGLGGRLAAKRAERMVPALIHAHIPLLPPDGFAICASCRTPLSSRYKTDYHYYCPNRSCVSPVKHCPLSLLLIAMREFIKDIAPDVDAIQIDTEYDEFAILGVLENWDRLSCDRSRGNDMHAMASTVIREIRVPPDCSEGADETLSLELIPRWAPDQA